MVYTNLRIDITLDQPDPSGAFYDATVTVLYRSRLTSSRFVFARVLDYKQFDARIRDPNTFTWRLEETPDLPKHSPAALNLQHLTIDGITLPSHPRIAADGTYEIICEDPTLVHKNGTDVAIHYTVTTKLKRHDHVLFWSAPQPTRGATITLNYARTDIAAVLIYDFLTPPTTPTIQNHPGRAVVHIDGWALAKNGIVFVWRHNPA